MKRKTILLISSVVLMLALQQHAEAQNRHYRGIAWVKVEYLGNEPDRGGTRYTKGTIYYVYADLGVNNVREEAGEAAARNFLLRQFEREVGNGRYKLVSSVQYDIELSPNWSYGNGYDVPRGAKHYGGSASVMSYTNNESSKKEMFNINYNCESPFRADALEKMVSELSRHIHTKNRDLHSHAPMYTEQISFSMDTCTK